MAFVLILEDSPGVRRQFTVALEDAGYVTQSAASMSEAIGLLESRGRADVLVADLNLDGRFSGEFAVRVLEEGLVGKVLVVSGSYEPEEIMGEIGERGAFLRKPVGLEELTAAVRRLI